MHLSALSDGFFSDSIRDSAAPIFAEDHVHDQHAAGLIRGLIFVAAVACAAALATIPSWLHQRAADSGFAEFTGHPSDIVP